jgi:hypothetical protein
MITLNRTDEAEIRHLVDRWVRDLSTRHLVAPGGDQSLPKPVLDVDKWFATWPDSGDREMRCLMIGAGGVVYCHSRNRTRSGLWVRASVAMRKIEGRWHVMQERICGVHEPGEQSAAA